MMGTPHILAGAAVAKLLRRPALAYPAAFASHFVLDAIPHLDASTIFGAGVSGMTHSEVVARTVDAMVGAAILVWFAGPWSKGKRGRRRRSRRKWDPRKWDTAGLDTAGLDTRRPDTGRLDAGRWDARKWGGHARHMSADGGLSALCFLLWAGFFGLLPDLLDSIPVWGPLFRSWPATAWFSRVHHGIQPNVSLAHWPLGVATQVLVVALAVWVLAARARRGPSPA